MEHTSIPELIEKSIAGERSAQEALIRATQNHIYYHCVKMLKREADAQNMAQEILIAMLKHLPQLREPAVFWSWLNAITANQCRRALTREGHGTLPLEEDAGAADWLEDQDAQVVPDQALDSQEARRMVMDLVDSLPLPSGCVC